MTKSNHVHKLKRHTYNTGAKIYFCILPDCHFKIAVELSLGKMCICHRCGEAFKLNEYSIRLAKPHCDNCHHRKDKNAKVEKQLPVAVASDSISSLRERLVQSVQTVLEETKDPEDDIL